MKREIRSGKESVLGNVLVTIFHFCPSALKMLCFEQGKKPWPQSVSFPPFEANFLTFYPASVKQAL